MSETKDNGTGENEIRFDTIENSVMKFDELLDIIGEFGPYQKRIFVLTCLVAITAGAQAMSVVFLLDIPAYRCAIPGYGNDTFSPQSPHHEHLINLTIPIVENSQGEATHSKCKLYNATRDNPGDSFTQYECDVWVYDTSVRESTVISEFNMVCKNQVFRSVGAMAGFSGGAVGNVVFGVLSDGIGRKKALLLAVLLNAAVGVVNAVSQSFLFYAVTVFFIGVTLAAQFMIAIVIAMEIVGPHKRTLTGIAVGYFWVGGLFLLDALAHFIRGWRHLRLALAIPLVVFIGLWWLIPESPRWLISKEKYEEAKKIIRKIAKANKQEVDEDTLAQVTVDQKGKKNLHFWHMFLSPRLLLRTLVIYFSIFVVFTVYVGLSINVGNLSGNLYMNFFLSSLMELLGCVITHILMYRVGRRPLLIAFMMIGGVACLASIFPVLYGNTSTKWTIIALAMVGKLAVSASFAIIDFYSVEVFPTSVRQSSMAVRNIFGHLGGMTSPYIADLGILVGGNLTGALPLIVFGSLSVGAGLSDFLLPETRNRKLPETIQDAIDFGKEKRKRSNVIQEDQNETNDVTCTEI